MGGGGCPLSSALTTRPIFIVQTSSNPPSHTAHLITSPHPDRSPPIRSLSPLLRSPRLRPRRAILPSIRSLSLSFLVLALLLSIFGQDWMNNTLRSFSRVMSTTSTSAALSKNRVPSSLLNPTVFQNVHKLWFDGITTTEAVNDFPKEVMSRWYYQSDDLDKESRDKFHHVLEDLIESKATAEEIDSAITKPEERHSLVLLLDQLGRNIYREESAKKVYEKLDPLCEELVLKWTSEPTKIQHYPAWKDIPHVRSWFYMPMMHSESLSTHDRGSALQTEWLADLKAAGLATQFCDYQIDFEGKHRGVLEKYGRYPSRNSCLGRKSTPEEEEMLKNGPGW